MSLPTPSETVEKLQTSLQTKAKAEPAFRFYALWDKVCRQDVLLEAYRRCRANAGAAGVDGETFAQIDARGSEQWLGMLREELVSGRYAPKPLLRVWIPKSNGGQRPLGIPCICDRVAQMAAVLIIGPIFEADLLPQQYGFRPGLDAKMALRRVYWHVTQHGRREVVDADLRNYFTSIPHAPLMRSLSRRIADGHMLHVIKCWLTAPVVEVIDGRPVQTTEARRTKRGTPQGGVISPLLANCYFRRFLLAWHNHGHRDQLDAHVVNYADDLVICCRPRQRRSGDGADGEIDGTPRIGGEHDEDPDRPIARVTVRLPRLHGWSLPRQGWAPLLRHPSVEKGGEELAQAYPRADYAAVVSG
jgi:retron-type reverse transcriptase